MVEESFQQDSAGLYLPAPSHRQIRQLMFSGGLVLEAEEEAEEIQSLVDKALLSGGWAAIHEPTFGTAVRIPNSALSELRWVGEAWKDMAMVRKQMEMAEHTRRMQAAGVAPPGAGPVPFQVLQASDNRAARRARNGRG